MQNQGTTESRWCPALFSNQSDRNVITGHRTERVMGQNCCDAELDEADPLSKALKTLNVCRLPPATEYQSGIFCPNRIFRPLHGKVGLKPGGNHTIWCKQDQDRKQSNLVWYLIFPCLITLNFPGHTCLVLLGSTFLNWNCKKSSAILKSHN